MNKKDKKKGCINNNRYKLVTEISKYNRKLFFMSYSFLGVIILVSLTGLTYNLRWYFSFPLLIFGWFIWDKLTEYEFNNWLENKAVVSRVSLYYMNKAVFNLECKDAKLYF